MPKALNETDLNRVERLRVRRAFLFVAKGHVERRRSIVIQARKRPKDTNPATTMQTMSTSTPSEQDAIVGAGFTATKKIGGAVVRNRAKRRMRECAKILLPQLGVPNVDYVFIARRDTGTRQWTALLDDVESALLSLREKILSGKPPAPQTRRSNSKRANPRKDEKQK